MKSRRVRGWLLVVALLAGCGGSATTTDPTERPPTVDEEVAQYVRSYGGADTQYRAILAMNDCDQLATLFQTTVEKQRAEVELSPAWKAALGYSTAVNHRQLEIDC